MLNVGREEAAAVQVQVEEDGGTRTDAPAEAALLVGLGCVVGQGVAAELLDFEGKVSQRAGEDMTRDGLRCTGRAVGEAHNRGRCAVSFVGQRLPS